MSKIIKVKTDIPLGRTRQILKSRLTRPALALLAAEALEEDLGAGDVTACIFTDDKPRGAYFLARQDGVLSGTNIVEAIFRHLSPTARIRWHLKDGARFTDNQIVADVTAPMATLLAGERTALNFMQQLSGVATLTAAYVKAVEGTSIGIYDTRKTTPTLRPLEKQAVVHGGGNSHRFGLYDMAMLKNNHIDAAGGIAPAVAILEADGFFRKRPKLALCIEARDLSEAVQAFEANADLIMLDNMPPAQISRTIAHLSTLVTKMKPLPAIEVSGGINLKSIHRYRNFAIDRISVGAITHSPPAIDISFRFKK